ncbi:tRNA nucleotidyltransferase cca2 isoform X2 [Coffea arabica]|uniref:tRNA nucleotidyltransferase cca2 isoform X2 n=1 Tax=Coffea arabica TaxID=13443 RepID=A0A6P6UYT8_COFAR|nr:putative CCA tRNA nucleotidyltransferase 2 isoform X2 [Coffea arabica]
MKLPIALNRSANRLFTSQAPPFFFRPLISFPLLRISPIRPNTANSSLKFSSFKSTGPFLRFYNSTMAITTATTTTASSHPPIQVRDHIELTPKEKEIFYRLLQVIRHFDLETELRVAGGWVRDKLLGKDSDDIDIAIDTMSGREFCEKINEYLSYTGEETPGIGLIQCNPDQSKHLETARMRLFDVWIDFVNLRSEDYSESSRIPVMRFGTAKEDAYRRDLTINSLFYNINKDSVEDLTERGISDLKSGKIVTPLPPKQTFLDDPLRVLRAIRFGARFGFALDEELRKAASDEEVKAAIANKISRERIGHEIDLMVSGNQPVKAMTYVSDLQLFGAVFSLPLEFEPEIPDRYDRVCVADFDSAWRLLEAIGCPFSADQQRLFLYAALFLPFRENVYKEKKAKKIPVVSYIIRNSLKLKASDAEMVISLHIATKKFVSLIPFVVSKEDIQILEVDWKREIIDVPFASKLRILAGLLLRDIKDFWRAALLLSMLLYPTDIYSATSSFEFDKRREVYNMVEEAILGKGLDKVWEVKPLVDGKEIMSILDLKTGGPLVREWQQKLIEWQLAHPFESKDKCIQWMNEASSKRARLE